MNKSGINSVFTQENFGDLISVAKALWEMIFTVLKQLFEKAG
ncbi:MAG: hypothetical protein ACI4GA_05645 [Acutalibacteraceae bacterium]|nr:hypothetical protein [Oscillospiraceae bacterium]